MELPTLPTSYSLAIKNCPTPTSIWCFKNKVAPTPPPPSHSLGGDTMLAQLKARKNIEPPV